MGALEYKKGRRHSASRFRAAAILHLIPFVAAIVSFPAQAQHGEKTITCTNPVSGASWEIKIDYDARTVDSNPARISDAEISWRDGKDGRNYALDRRSGNLTIIVASATGGNFLYHRCKPEN